MTSTKSRLQKFWLQLNDGQEICIEIDRHFQARVGHTITVLHAYRQNLNESYYVAMYNHTTSQLFTISTAVQLLNSLYYLRQWKGSVILLSFLMYPVTFTLLPLLVYFVGVAINPIWRVYPSTGFQQWCFMFGFILFIFSPFLFPIIDILSRGGNTNKFDSHIRQILAGL